MESEVKRMRKSNRSPIREGVVSLPMALLLGFSVLPICGCDYQDLISALTGEDDDDFDRDQIGDAIDDELDDEFDR